MKEGIMDPATITAFSAAVVAILGAITALIVALRPILLELRKNTAVTVQAATDAQDAAQAASEAAEVGQQTHDMVNSQRDAALRQQTRTDNALRAAGIPIPHNPAAEVQVSGTDEVK